MPTSTQDSGRERHRLLQSLQEFSQGVGEAPMVTKWTQATESVVASSGECELEEFHRKDSANEPKHGHENPTITFVLSTDEVDRHGDIISADGWVLDSYRENPVLLWAHDYRQPAIGRAAKLWDEPHRLMAKMEFAPTEFAQEVADLYRSGFQWGVSVGFKPLRYEERRDEKTGEFLGLRFLEQELLEVSAVPVPANRSALRRSDQPDFSTLIALWPVLASQVDELAKLSGEIAETVAELENTAKGGQHLERVTDQVAEILTALRSGRA
ncbi:MAG: HK97 family phage prohead protease [Chloroflexi bacterium]|nr:HK97 family phage prohead protease [Chloroflexota bacterium]